MITIPTRTSHPVAPQDTFIFSGNVRENIRYGRLDATDEATSNIDTRSSSVFGRTA